MPKKDFAKSMDISYRSYPNSNLSGRTFRFSIKNISNHNFLLRLRNVFDTYSGLLSKEGKNFYLDFLQIIETSFKDTIDISRHNVLNFGNEDFVSEEKELINYYNSIFWYKKTSLLVLTLFI